MIRAGLTQWLQMPPFRGRLALLCGIGAVALPTAVRFAVNGVVTGCEFTPYLPFVFLSAILLGSWQAGFVALASTVILGGLFMRPPNTGFEAPCFIFGAAIFLASSAIMIGVVLLARRVIAGFQRHHVDEGLGGIIFSLEKGEVWASWYGQGPPVHLGSQRRVSEMMKDFLAQVELGRRLNNRPESGRPTASEQTASLG